MHVCVGREQSAPGERDGIKKTSCEAPSETKESRERRGGTHECNPRLGSVFVGIKTCFITKYTTLPVVRL